MRAERPDPDASGHHPLYPRDQQPAAGRRIGTGETGQLGLEPLEGEVDAQALRVFGEEAARLGEQWLGVRRLHADHARVGHRARPGISAPAMAACRRAAPSTMRGPGREV